MEGLSLITDGELYAVDVTAVQKVVRNMPYTRTPAAQDAIAGIANLKGGVITLLCLSVLLGRERNDRAANAIIFKPPERRNNQMGLLVDCLGDLIHISDAAIREQRAAREGEDHALITGYAEIDGKLCRIISTEAITGRWNEKDEEI